MRGAIITGTGHALPEKVVTNADLAATMDTSDEWIIARTGIRERRIGGTTTGLAVEAGRKALAEAGTRPEDVDLLILATTTPDRTVPASSAGVAHQLGLGCGAMDLNAACSGWVYGLVTAHGLIATGLDTVLVVGSETLSRITDWDDRTTAILFADGAGAAVVQATGDDRDQLLGYDLVAEGSAEKYLFAEFGGYMEMVGKEVFRRAVALMADSAERSMVRAGVTADDIDVVVPHQANVRIIDASCRRLGIPYEKAVVTLPYLGNTSAASVPTALDIARAEGRVGAGDLLLLVGFGAGMTAASAVIRWGG